MFRQHSPESCFCFLLQVDFRKGLKAAMAEICMVLICCLHAGGHHLSPFCRAGSVPGSLPEDDEAVLPRFGHLSFLAQRKSAGSVGPTGRKRCGRPCQAIQSYLQALKLLGRSSVVATICSGRWLVGLGVAATAPEPRPCAVGPSSTKSAK